MGSERTLIRCIRKDDYDAVRAVWMAAGLSVRSTGRDAREPFCRQLAQFPSTYLLAEEQAYVIGVVLGTHDHRKGWINRLAVIPEYRGRGVGRLLISRCEQALFALGVGIVAALVEDGNDASCAAFRRAGYGNDVRVTYFRKLARPDV